MDNEEVKKFLIEKELTGIVSLNFLALKLGVSRNTIIRAKERKALKSIGNNCFSVKDIAKWLIKEPRYMAQKLENWEITENIKIEVLKLMPKWSYLTRAFEVDDLVQEVLIILSRRKKTNVSLKVVVDKILHEIYRKEKNKALFNSLELRQEK